MSLYESTYSRTFEEHGRLYGDGGDSRPRWEARLFVPWITQGAKVLDLGCGDGGVSQMIARERKAFVTGIEVDPAGVKEARARGIDVRIGNLDDPLPFPDDSFDVVVLCGVMHMILRPGFALKEALRVAPKVICSFPNLGFWLYRMELLLVGKFPRHLLYHYRWHDTRHVHHFSIADMRDLCRELGAVETRLACAGLRTRWGRSRVSHISPNLLARVAAMEITSPRPRPTHSGS